VGLRTSEDPRATRGKDTPSVVERAAVADGGSRFREVQLGELLRGSKKPESRGTKIGEVAPD
jgi:hypothetical protein